MEKDYNAKLKYSKETVDEQIKEACRGILKEKDDEINKLGIKVHPGPLSMIHLICTTICSEKCFNSINCS